MNRLQPCPLPILSALLSTATLGAQISVGQPILQTQTLQQIRRLLPAELGGGSAQRAIRFDPDGDLLHDVAMLWSGGQVVFSYAPEIMSAFVALPIVNATGIARVPAASLPAPIGDGDHLLVATAGGLFGVRFRALAVGSTAEPTGFSMTPIAAAPHWHQVSTVETYWDGSDCWVFGVEGDQLTVRIGLLVHGGIVDVGGTVAAAPVRQVLPVVEAGANPFTIVARTDAGLEFWNGAGGTATPPLAADTASPLGGITAVHQGGDKRLAWLMQSGCHWRLSIVSHGVVLQTVPVAAPPAVPGRFRPTGLYAITLPSGDDALVVGQNTTVHQLVLTVDSQTGIWQPTCSFAFTGMTANVDDCPPIVEDFNNDGHVDYATVLTSQHALQIDTGLPIVIANAVHGAPLVADTVDLLPHACTLSAGVLPDDTLTLYAAIPFAYATTPNLFVQVVAWPQTVQQPAGGTGGYLPQPITGASRHLLFPVSDQTGLSPMLPIRLDDPANGAWSPTRHYYFLVRLVSKVDGVVISASPAQFVAMVANFGSAPTYPGTLNYLASISTYGPGGGGGGGGVGVQGSNRNVGVVQKPDRIDPPNTTLKPPAPGQASPGAASGQWQ